jgi:DNA-directed RNA polymerase specialized sigma subunit
MATDSQIGSVNGFLVGLTNADGLIVQLYGEGATMAEIATVLRLPESKVLQMHLSIIARLESYLQNLVIAAN